MFNSKLFIYFLLFNILCESYAAPYQNRKLSQFYRQRLPEYDNRYVWFTRDLHGSEPIDHTQENMLLKRLNKFFYRI